ncbi:protoporphyrinogen oxidase isoform X3 [Aphelocoma coerulescens]|uniref:protoporphyrinogen oxidase isoform X3 n=1 Tax=Aphelocoma coerulescens TaxID=39617 RepID=UPI0036046941
MPPTVAVVGGGISGLAACYHLVRAPRPPKVVLLEASGRFGGWLQSTRTPEGAVFEHGPRGVRPAGAVGAETLHMGAAPGRPPLFPGAALERGAGPGDPGGDGAGRERPRLRPPPLRPRGGRCGRGQPVPGGVRRGQPHPECPVLLPGPVPGRAAPRLRPAGAGTGTRGGVAAGGGGGAGPASAGRALEPVVTAGGDGDPGAGLGGLRVPPRGRAALPRAPEAPVPPPRPLAALAEALPAEAEPLARELRRIPAASVAVVNLQYEGATLPVTGFGHLVPSSEDPALLGIVYDSVAFPEHDGTPGTPSLRLTVMLGGAWFRQSFGDPAAAAPELLLRRARAAVRDHLGLAGTPARAIVRVQQDCIPQYTLGHWERLERIQQFLKEQQLPLSLIGASYAGVSVNDCISSAKAAVGRLLGSLP